MNMRTFNLWLLVCTYCYLLQSQVVHGWLPLPAFRKFTSVAPPRVLFASSNVLTSVGPEADDTTPSKVLRSVTEDINSVIDQILAYYKTAGSLDKLDPSILTENAHILCKSNLYEGIIKKRVETAGSAENSTDLQRVDALMRGFISSERKARARMKVNYMLAGASSERFEEAITLLSEA